MRIKILLLSFLFFGFAANAVEKIVKFPSEAQEKQYYELIKDLRCVKCPNESLVSSQAAIAQELRAKVYQKVIAKSSDQDIIDYLIARYGDKVVYRPRFKPSTYVLWLLPIVLLIIAVTVVIRKVSAMPKGEAGQGDIDEERITELLEQSNRSKDNG